MRGDVTAFTPLARDREVWVYDQVGTGASTRLADVTGYTSARAVDDLTAVVAATAALRERGFEAIIDIDEIQSS
jgi:pimeloyl-ACP methyl ester carboxylesterase